MPPCMQISVAPAARLVDPVADLLHRQRVGVGVGAPLGERAEPAAGVADVGEVDVPVHDVGDVVAVDVGADGIGQRQRLEVGAVGAQQRQVLGVGQPGRVDLGVQQGRQHLAVAGGQRGGVPSRAESCARAAPTSRRRPRRSRPPVRCPPDRVHLDVQVHPPRRRPRLVRLLPRQPDRDAALDRQPVGAGQRGHVRAHRGSSHGSGCEHVRRLGGQPLAQLEPASADSARACRCSATAARG